jgi:4'-phosphopantetheinyl transferase
VTLPTLDRPACDALLVHASTAELLEVARRDAWLALLSPDERARHARFRFEPDRDTYLVAHGLLRVTLAELTGHAAASFAFVAGEHGRPELADASLAASMRFNLSHTRGRIACGFTRGADVGVDVEENQRDVQLREVAERVYSEAELAALFALPAEAQRARFFELWTLKEAYIKAIGKGFSAPLRAITFDAGQSDPVPLRLGAEIADDAASWCCKRFSAGDQHALAMVWRGNDASAARCVELSARDFVD